ncbi:unnamed protein product [Closterium sp. Yama58-4]|nr:unnamed protein product [Closterium sp. Yama58-4]
MAVGQSSCALTPGQGANLAFEDVAQLVECLRAHSHVSDALRSFQSLRMPRVQAVAARYAAASRKLYDEKKGKNAAGNEGGSGGEESEVDPAPKFEEVQAAMAAVAAREGRDPDEDLYGYDIAVWEEDHRIASAPH